MVSPLSRRTWLRQSLGAVAGLTAATTLPLSVYSRPIGANEAVRLAVVGLRIRGTQLIDQFQELPNVRIAALCDVDQVYLDREQKGLADVGTKVACVKDFRRLLDRKDIDAVVIATPDHWHALMTVWACQAGKDVYVEKPVSHNIWEGRQMVRAARKYNRIVQAGTQNRADVGFHEAVAFMKREELGLIRFAWIINYVAREGIGKVPGPQPVPSTVDYDLFMGPAPMEPLRRKNLHYDWHWIWSTGTGECGNRGAHAFDHARWLMGEERAPTGVQTIGGRFGWDDDGETPNTQITLFEGLKVPMIYELRNLPKHKGTRQMDKFRGHGTSMLIECEHGYIVGGRGFMMAHTPDRKLIKRFKCDAGKGHQANFIAAMRSRKSSELYADVETGHVSSLYCHLANISFLTGQPRLDADIARAAQLPRQFAESCERLQQHLEVNEIQLDKSPLILGPKLTFNTITEKFTGETAAAANALLSRDYRKPFVLPENV